MLQVDESRWTGKKKPKAKDHFVAKQLARNPDATVLADLGDVGYSDPGSDFGQYPGRPSVAWATWLRHGKAFADRELRVFGKDLDIAVLEDLARAVRSDATPGDPPVATAPGDAALPLFASWTLTGGQGIRVDFEPPTMTATFDDAGTLTTAFDCKGLDGKQPDAYTYLYLVDSDRIAMVTDPHSATSEQGQCFDDNGRPELGQIQLVRAFGSLGEATWTVDGDMLTITGPTSAWTFERASD
jgi:hypothetical protein